MKSIFTGLFLLFLGVVFLAGCTSAPTTVVVSQTPVQVAKNFCSQVGVTVGDLKLLTDLPASDQQVISQVDTVSSKFCDALKTTGTVDLNTINTEVTQQILSLLSASNIANKDKYEIAIIVAQSIVTQYLSNLTVTAG